MSVNQVYNYSKAEYPKSLMKLVKFYRLFGFSFLGITSEDNEKKLSKIKRYLLMAYNLVVIFVIISFQIYVTSDIFEEQQKFEMKKVLKGVLLVSRLITCSDIIFGYLLPLIKGKQFLKFLSNEELCAIDCNTRKANKIIGSLIIGLTIMGGFCTTFYFISRIIFFKSIQTSNQVVFIIIKLLFLTTFYYNGHFLIPVFYYCITSLFINQINELNSGVSKGIIDILCILTL
jgi:hypothetical protein